MDAKTLKLPNILVTGTPGVGKTTLCSLLESSLHEEGYSGFKYCLFRKAIINVYYIENNVKIILLAERIREQKLYKDWNEKFNVSEFDEDMVCDNLEDEMQAGGIILEFHTSSFFPERWFDIVVLLRCDNTKLYDRLEERGYEQEKITENIECEIMEVTSEEVRESYKEEVIMELRSEDIDQVEQNIELIKDRVKALIQQE